MIVDTDILIWVTKGHAGAARFLAQHGVLKLSAVTQMEILQGARDAAELGRLKAYLGGPGIRILPITEAVSAGAVTLVERHALADGLRVADALIAATALVDGDILATTNQRHFRPIAGLTVNLFKP
jgi:predicted nucleic acid-binding protein